MSDRCSNCGRVVPEGAKFCPFCGERRVAQDLPLEQVSLRFAPPASVAVAPGGSAALDMTVTNVGTLVAQVHALVAPPANAWASVEPACLSVMPSERMQAKLKLQPPPSADVAAGDHQVVVTLSSDAEGTKPLAREAGLAHVQPVRQLTVRIVPRHDAGRRTSARQVELTNTGNAALDISLSASDPDDALVFGVPPGPIELPMRGKLSCRIDVRARRPKLRGRPLKREFSVRASWQDGGSILASAQFMQKSWRLVIALMILVLALAALPIAVAVVQP
jgi:hypothetical protein